MTVSGVKDVMPVVAKELEISQSIYDVTLEIGATIEAGDMAALAAKLGEREHLIHQLMRLEEELQSLVAQWEESNVVFSDELRRREREVHSLVECIVALDRVHREAIAEEISGEFQRILSMN